MEKVASYILHKVDFEIGQDSLGLGTGMWHIHLRIVGYCYKLLTVGMKSVRVSCFVLLFSSWLMCLEDPVYSQISFKRFLWVCDVSHSSADCGMLCFSRGFQQAVLRPYGDSWETRISPSTSRPPSSCPAWCPWLFSWTCHSSPSATSGVSVSISRTIK